MIDRLVILAKIIFFVPLSIVLAVIWLPYWILSGGNPFPHWMREAWKAFNEIVGYD